MEEFAAGGGWLPASAGAAAFGTKSPMGHAHTAEDVADFKGATLAVMEERLVGDRVSLSKTVTAELPRNGTSASAVVEFDPAQGDGWHLEGGRIVFDVTGAFVVSASLTANLYNRGPYAGSAFKPSVSGSISISGLMGASKSASAAHPGTNDFTVAGLSASVGSASAVVLVEQGSWIEFSMGVTGTYQYVQSWGEAVYARGDITGTASVSIRRIV